MVLGGLCFSQGATLLEAAPGSFTAHTGHEGRLASLCFGFEGKEPGLQRESEKGLPCL